MDDRLYVRDAETGEVLGKLLTNQSLTFDQIMRLVGAEWHDEPNESGWTFDGGVTLYDESTIDIGYAD